MSICCKKNWRIAFYLVVLMLCSASSVQSGARWFSQYSKDNTDSHAAEKAADVAEKATEAVKREAGSAAEKAADVAEKATEAVKREAGSAAEKAADVAEKATEAVKREAGSAAEKAADVAEKATEAVKREAGSAAEKAADVAEKATEAVKREAGSAAEKAADMAEKATEAVKREAGSAAEKAADVAEKATEAVKREAGSAAEKAADVAEKATEAVKREAGSAAEKAADVAEKATEAVKREAGSAGEKAATALSVQGALQSRESILEKQKVLFKDYDLDKLLHNIRTVLEHNNLKTVQKQFHQLFDKKDSSVYSCAFENVREGENLPAVKDQIGELQAINEKNDTKVESHDHEDHLQNAQNLLEKAHEISDGVKLQQGQDSSQFSAKTLYKKGYDSLLAANYGEAEKAFCAFQQRYKTDPLGEDALFWLAESLLGQKRYHEAAQVYLNVWYADKKKAYTSEILLKLARSMVALEQNKETCALFAKKAKHPKSLEAVFCKPIK
ncbi:hypothetical protein [Bartonella acomydis]|uniref:Tol-Pal system protein YbgF n=1 Tax=Bartonella acomydis TaxID=686234 RepID=A0ABP9MHZ3_9HYPH